MGAALTPNETEVLALLRGANGPMTAYQLLGRMQRNGGAVAPPTVYRADRSPHVTRGSGLHGLPLGI